MDTHDKLLKTLLKIDRPSVICTSGDLPVTMPGLIIDKVGEINLPLNKTQAKQLIKHSHQAPYGKGIDTLVDTDVRQTWELDAEQLTFANPGWKDFIENLTTSVQSQLGLENHQLKSNLYKLLIYEKDGFFLPHRDGEKLDRMVATLVIALPSVHKGGELIVSQDNKQYKIQFEGAKSGYELSYAAFYADCQHEIKPIQSGYRLALTYNLTLEKSSAKKGINAPSWQNHTDDICRLLKKWQDEIAGSFKTKIAILLDHRYTQEGLSVDTLKGIDRAKAEVLFNAATQADCMSHLALVTLWQSGTVADEYDYSYSHRRSYDSYDDEAGDHVMDEIFDESLSADHWSNPQGEKKPFGEIILDDSEIITDQDLEEGDPEDEEYEGYTGNAGMTLERWYHRAAIIIWPNAKHFEVLCEAGTDQAIKTLKPMVAQLKHLNHEESKNQLQECLVFSTRIIDTWDSPYNASWRKNGKGSRVAFTRLLVELDNATLIHNFFSKVLISDGSIKLNKAFCKTLKKHGWASFEAELNEVIRTANNDTINRNAELLELFCLLPDKNTERIALCTHLAHQAVIALQEFDEQTTEPGWIVQQSVKPAALLASLVNAMLAIHAEKSLSRLIDYVLQRTDNYKLTTTHLPAIFSIESQLAASSNPKIMHWLTYCRQELEKRTESTPKRPADFQRKAKLSCNCADCQVLSAFLADPDRQQARYPLAERRRQHLHQIINSNGCDLTHETERVGRPYTLVCTKTLASYNTTEKTYARDLDYLSRILTIIQSGV